MAKRGLYEGRLMTAGEVNCFILFGDRDGGREKGGMLRKELSERHTSA